MPFVKVYIALAGAEARRLNAHLSLSIILYYNTTLIIIQDYFYTEHLLRRKILHIIKYLLRREEICDIISYHIIVMHTKI